MDNNEQVVAECDEQIRKEKWLKEMFWAIYKGVLAALFTMVGVGLLLWMVVFTLRSCTTGSLQ